jgi:hypothetical protein
MTDYDAIVVGARCAGSVLATRLGQALDTYQTWRDASAAEHYEWSFHSAHLPHPEHGQPVFAGPAADPHAAQEWRDLFTRLRRPSGVFTAERTSRWAASWQDRPRIGEPTAHG